MSGVAIRLVGPEGADPGAALLELSGRQKDKLCEVAFRRRVRMIRKAAGAEFITGGIGRRIWGRKPEKAAAVVLARIKRERYGMTATLEPKAGIPGMVEDGGHIQPHVIEPKLADTLAFVQAGALRYADGKVQHPGADVAKDPFLGPEVRSGEAELQKDVERVMDGYWERVTRKGSR